VAGSLYVVGATAYAAVRASRRGRARRSPYRRPRRGREPRRPIVALRKATVLGIAGPDNADWLRAHDVTRSPTGRAGRATARRGADGIDAFIDLFGPDYVQLAVDLGVAPERIDTIISFQKAGEVGAKTEGSGEASTREYSPRSPTWSSPRH